MDDGKLSYRDVLLCKPNYRMLVGRVSQVAIRAIAAIVSQALTISASELFMQRFQPKQFHAMTYRQTIFVTIIYTTHCIHNCFIRLNNAMSAKNCCFMFVCVLIPTFHSRVEVLQPVRLTNNQDELCISLNTG